MLPARSCAPPPPSRPRARWRAARRPGHAERVDCCRPRYAASIQPSAIRSGWYIDRTAFGSDLYRHGRATVLHDRRGRRRTANAHLVEAWERSRAIAETCFAATELDLVDRIIDRQAPLPLEDPRFDETAPGLHAGSTQPSPFEHVTRERTRPGFRIAPRSIAWNAVVFDIHGARECRRLHPSPHARRVRSRPRRRPARSDDQRLPRRAAGRSGAHELGAGGRTAPVRRDHRVLTPSCPQSGDLAASLGSAATAAGAPLRTGATRAAAVPRAAAWPSRRSSSSRLS